MSFFTSRMRLLTAIVIDDKSDNVTKELLNLGLLDFIEVSHLIDDEEIRLTSRDDKEVHELTELRKRLETIYNQADTAYPFRETLSINQMTEYKADISRAVIDKISAELQTIRERQKKLHQEVLKHREITEYLSTSTSKKENSFLNIHRGKPGRGNFDDMLDHLTAMPHFGTKIDDTESYFLVYLKRDQSLVNDIFQKYQWIENDAQNKNEREKAALLEDIRLKTAKIEAELDDARLEMKNIVLKNKDSLDSLWKNLRIHELYQNIKNNFSYTEKTSLFSGWLPADKSIKVENAIRSASNGECLIEWTDPEKFQRNSVPVEIKQPKVLAPFQMLVENYAVPEYGTIDPTIFVAIAYMIMFGLMFGDAGQGLVVALIGLLGRRLMKEASTGVRNLLQLFIYCGSASIISGILFGSYFGYKLFPPLWFDYHAVVSGHNAAGSSSITNVYDILKITIFFGIAVIGTGLIINWINLYRKKDFFHLLLDKSGILGGWFYGCGIYTSFFFVRNGYKTLPSANLLTVFFGIPIILMLFKAPLHFYLHERNEKKFTPFTIIDFFMEWIVELLEIFSGYLSNTLSFMRVAGLGIAHVSLMVAFDTIAGLTSGLGSIMILILGNILVIALEGLSAGIQALRLNYYEFFSRYFTGKGIAYNPVSLRNRKQEG